MCSSVSSIHSSSTSPRTFHLWAFNVYLIRKMICIFKKWKEGNKTGNEHKWVASPCGKNRNKQTDIQTTRAFPHRKKMKKKKKIESVPGEDLQCVKKFWVVEGRTHKLTDLFYIHFFSYLQSDKGRKIIIIKDWNPRWDFKRVHVLCTNKKLLHGA